MQKPKKPTNLEKCKRKRLLKALKNEKIKKIYTCKNKKKRAKT